MRRLLPLLLPVLLSACGAEPLAVGVVVANGASVAVAGRTPLDAAVSWASGRSCSVVRLDRGQDWCAPPEAPPARMPRCTRSLGAVDCWVDPPP